MKLVDWRKKRALSQAEAATLFGVTRVTVARWEKGAAMPPAALAIMRGEVSEPEDKPAPKAKAAKPDEETPAELVEAMKRVPLFAKTSAEAFAMRSELHRRDNTGLGRSNMPLIPLRPDWVRVPMVTRATRKPISGAAPMVVNAAIPNPVGVDITKRYGPRAVMTADYAVYDIETAHRMVSPA